MLGRNMFTGTPLEVSLRAVVRHDSVTSRRAELWEITDRVAQGDLRTLLRPFEQATAQRH